MDRLKSPSKGSLTSANSDDIGHFDAFDSSALERTPSNSELHSDRDSLRDNSSLAETLSLGGDDGMTIRISPEKTLTLPSASLTAAQAKALIGGYCAAGLYFMCPC